MALSPFNGQNRYRQFCGGKFSIVCRILNVKSLEHFKRRAHCAFLSVRLGVDAPLGFRKSFRVRRMRLPEMHKEDALTSFNEVECNRTLDELKMRDRSSSVAYR